MHELIFFRLIEIESEFLFTKISNSWLLSVNDRYLNFFISFQLIGFEFHNLIIWICSIILSFINLINKSLLIYIESSNWLFIISSLSVGLTEKPSIC